jgi:mRNA interferase MazF
MAISRSVSRGEVCLIQLDPTRGSEIRKTRPCLVISPDELNQHLHALIVVPMTTGGQAYPWRVACRFRNRAGFVAIDQLRTVDMERITKRLGRISSNTLFSVLKVLQEMFSV